MVPVPLKGLALRSCTLPPHSILTGSISPELTSVPRPFALRGRGSQSPCRDSLLQLQKGDPEWDITLMETPRFPWKNIKNQPNLIAAIGISSIISSTDMGYRIIRCDRPLPSLCAFIFFLGVMARNFKGEFWLLSPVMEETQNPAQWKQTSGLLLSLLNWKKPFKMESGKWHENRTGQKGLTQTRWGTT